MKRAILIISVLLTFFGIILTCSSCTKKEEASKGMTRKEEIKLTPEQEKQKGKIREGIKKSRNIVVARVNGSDINMYYLVKEMNVIAPKLIPHGQPATAEITARVKKKALNNLIFKELAIQEAIKGGMKVKPETVEDIINKVRAQAGSEEAYKKYLEDRNLDEETLKKTVERNHLLEMITAREIFDKIKVDDNTIRRIYEKDKASLMTKDNPPRQMSFEEAKGHIESRIRSEIGQKRIGEWDAELRKKAKIEVMNDEVEKTMKDN